MKVLKSAFNYAGKMFGKTAKAAKPAEVAEVASTVRGTVIKPSIPGVEVMERSYKGTLFQLETRTLADGTKKSTLIGFSNDGAYIGKGGDQGLAVYRDTTRAIEEGESVLGGKIRTIEKQYHDTMGSTGKNIKVRREYTPEGIMEHSETSVQYRHWSKPEVTIYDRSKTLTGETAYGEAIKAKKAAESAAKAEQEAVAAAALKAEQEAAEALRATQPRVNVGKVFNKNLDEFKMLQEKTLADGTVVRRYAAKGKDGANQYIVTKDRGSYHEEYLVDTAKDMKIKFTQLGEEAPRIEMRKGMQLRQTVDGEQGSQLFYNDGIRSLELSGHSSSVGRFRIEGEEGMFSGRHEIPDLYYGVSYKPYTPVDPIAQKNLKSLTNDVNKEWVDLQGMFKPYEA